MPIQDIDPGSSPEAPGNWYFYKQGSATSTGATISSEGDATFAGTVTAGTIAQTNPTPNWFNVKAYGASTSASAATNDAAFTAAVAAAAVSGGVVYVPAGTYSISQPITITSDSVSIKGDGMHTSNIVQTSTTANGITISKSGPRYSVIENIWLTGPSSGTGNGIVIDTTSATASASIDISHVFVEKFGANGVDTDTLITSCFTDIRVSTLGGIGFNISGGTSITMLDCYAVSTGAQGYLLTGVSYSSLINCACDSPTGDGYSFASGTGNSLISCGFEVGLANGFKFSGVSNQSVLACYNRGNAAIAYWVTGASNRVQFLNCREVSPVGTATAAVQVDSGSTASLLGNQATTANSLATSSTQLFLNTNLEIHSTGTASGRIDRGNTSSFASYTLQTAGVDQWALSLRNDTTNDLQLLSSARSTVALLAEDRATATNLSLLSATKDYQSGVGVIYVGNRTTAPTGTPAAGSLLYSDTQRLSTYGPFAIQKAGSGLQIKEGANACMGTATMVAGTVTVSTTAVTANSRIQLTVQSLGTVTAPKAIAVTARTAGTSFTITSADNTDTSVVAWQLVEPA